LWQHSGVRDLDALEWAATLLVISPVMLASYRTRKFLLNVERKRQWNDNLDNLIFQAALTTGAKYLPWIATSLAATLILLFQTSHLKETPFITEIAYSLTFYFLAVAVVSLLLAPVPPAKPFMEFMGNKDS